MPRYTEQALALLARVVAGVYGWDVMPWGERGGYIDAAGNTVPIPDYLTDPAAALGLLERLAADGRIYPRWYVCHDPDGYRCHAKLARGIWRAMEPADTFCRAIVAAVDALLREEEESDG